MCEVPGADFHVVGLQDGAALPAPVVLQASGPVAGRSTSRRGMQLPKACDRSFADVREQLPQRGLSRDAREVGGSARHGDHARAERCSERHATATGAARKPRARAWLRDPEALDAGSDGARLARSCSWPAWHAEFAQRPRPCSRPRAREQAQPQRQVREAVVVAPAPAEDRARPRARGRRGGTSRSSARR